ncbi:MAG TPA: hypothetical protein V6D14_18515 [Coleofasciculaceae cyanobacterium]|jgi:hypothetical protein
MTTSEVSDAIATLKVATLAAQTLGELYALMEVYSYEEFMQVYNQLTPEQQAQMNAMCDRDTKRQLAAINTINTSKR